MAIHDDLLAPVEDMLGHASVLLSATEGDLTDHQRSDIESIYINAEQFYNLVANTAEQDLYLITSELNTMLASIIGFTQLLLDYPEAYSGAVLNDIQGARVLEIGNHSRMLHRWLDELSR